MTLDNSKQLFIKLINIKHIRTISRTINGATYSCIEIYLKSTK